MTCEQGLLHLLWGGGPKLECYGTGHTLIAVYVFNAVSEYQAFVNDVINALQRVGSTEFMNLLKISTHTLEHVMKH